MRYRAAWKGYSFDNGQNGVYINFVNGIRIKDQFFAGIGIESLNFEGINGASIISEFESILLKNRLCPSLNTGLGYSHVWRQYKSGSGTALLEFYKFPPGA